MVVGTQIDVVSRFLSKRRPSQVLFVGYMLASVLFLNRMYNTGAFMS